MRCMRVLYISACLRRYSLRAAVVSSPPTLPQPAKGTTMQVQLSRAPRSSPKWTIVLAARDGSADRRARSTNSWSESMDVKPSVTMMMYECSSPSITRVVTSGSAVTPELFHCVSPKLLSDYQEYKHSPSRVLDCSHPSSFAKAVRYEAVCTHAT